MISDATSPDQFCIGLAAIQPGLYARMAASVDISDFAPSRRAIWRAIGEVVGAGQETNLLTVTRQLERAGTFTEALLGELLDCACLCPVYRVFEADQACAMLLSDRLEGIRRESVTSETAEAHLVKIQELRARIAVLRGDLDHDSLTSISEQLSSQLSGEHERDIRALDWNLYDLDDKTGGMLPGKFWAIGGRPGEGKSALVAHAAAWAIQHHRPTLYVTLEMPPIQCHDRLCCSLSGVSTEDRYRTQADRFKLKQTVDRLRLDRAPITYRTLPSIDAICALARQMAATGVLSLIVIDYLQLVEGSKSLPRGTQRYLQIQDVCRRLKNLGEEIESVVLVAALVGRVAGRPTLSAFRESGDIEASIDGGIIIHYGAEGIPKFTPGESVKAKLLVLKNRGGAIGEVDASFRREFTRWEDISARDDGLG